jgi:hypothetical protein
MNIKKLIRCDNSSDDQLSVGQVVEVLNQEGEVPGNYGFCARGARGRITELFADLVQVDINGKMGMTKQSNVIPYKPR